ncbi:SLAP domain-containing protein [Lactobacillus xylocopicola]|uniref:S-layer protein C-terminal domain-containing protein n=1 Tax=Lactobacillus xylocopicola TaxID=2976676 RepID=A0ABN6SNG9_9LACO|nr:SLAP domain-containing protein [Lactobacillus xylocopicola]BDR61164.1 hypothetical protein KIM322_14250 [Lactobacillus xylocopicola]
MKKTKKLFISLAAALMATTLAAPAVAKTNQVHAEEVTSPSPNTDQGKLTLNHKTRIYNKKGQKRYSYRGGNGLLKKDATVKYVGKVEAITDPDAKRYSFRDDDWNWFYLPYKTIKGKEYYNIGHGGYIKAINVDSIDGQRLYTNYATVTISAETLPSEKGNGYSQMVDNQGKFTGKYLKAGTKVVVDRRSDRALLSGSREIEGLANNILEVYRIKNNKQQFILMDDVKTKVRQILRPYTNFMAVKFVNDARLYDTDGNADKVITFKQGRGTDVVDLRYIWIPSENKAELFYRTLLTWSNDTSYVYVKASDVKYNYGRHLEPSNTADDVKK